MSFIGDSRTGDMKNNVSKLLREIKRMKLQVEPDTKSLILGTPSSFLPILHWSLLHYSLPLANWLVTMGYHLYGKSDLRFIEGMYRILREIFNYQPKLTKEQFLTHGYAEIKVILTYHLLLFCQAKHMQLTNGEKVLRRSLSSLSGRCDYKDTPPVVVSVWKEVTRENDDHTPLKAMPDDHTHLIGVRGQGALPTVNVCHTPCHTPPKGQVFTPCPEHSSAVRIQSTKELDITTTPTLHQLSPSHSSSSSPSHVLSPSHCSEFSPPPEIDDHENVTFSHNDPLPVWKTPPSKKEDVNCDPESLLAEPLLNQLNTRVQELTQMVDQMSARFVLVETQLLLEGNCGVRLSEREYVMENTQPSHNNVEIHDTPSPPPPPPSLLQPSLLQPSLLSSSSSPSEVRTPPINQFTSGIDTTGKDTFIPADWNSPMKWEEHVSATPTSIIHTPEETQKLIRNLRNRTNKTKLFLQHVTGDIQDTKEPSSVSYC